jgi:hypothetical protein
MTRDDDAEFWAQAPHLLDDPFGWVATWWRRIRNLTIVLEILAFAMLVGIVTWRLAVHGEVSESTVEVALMIGLAVTLAVQGALKRLRTRRSNPSGEHARR